MQIDINILKEKNMSQINKLASVNGSISMEEVYHEIKSEKHQNRIEMLRRYIREGRTKEAESVKKGLPGFTASGIFDTTRKKDSLMSYSGYICLDLDGITLEKLKEVKMKACQLKETVLCFESPSGNGLKILVCTEGNEGSHRTTYQKVQDCYSNILGVTFDEATSDLARLCFMSYDTHAYFNPNAEIFGTLTSTSVTPKVETQIPKVQTEKDVEELFVMVKQYTEQKETYQQGNRNNFVYLLANNSNRAGIEKQRMVELVNNTMNIDLPKAEFNYTVEGAYENTKEFNTWPREKFMPITPEFKNSTSGASSDQNQRISNDLDYQVKEAIAHGLINIGYFLLGQKGGTMDLHINKAAIKSRIA